MSGSEMEAKYREPEQGQGPVMIPKACKRLAEVDFPIAVVSKWAAKEKSIRHGHPSTLHLWWARRHAVPSRPAQPAVPPGTTGLGDRAWRMERDGRGWIMNLKTIHGAELPIRRRRSG